MEIECDLEVRLAKAAVLESEGEEPTGEALAKLLEENAIE